MAIPSDKESDSELAIGNQEEENAKGSAVTGPPAQRSGANPSVIPMEADVQLAMEIEQQEQEVEAGETMEVSVATQEELAMEVDSTPNLTSDHTYSTTVSLTMPSQIPSMVSSSATTPMPIYCPMRTNS